MDRNEARTLFQSDRAMHEARGVIFPHVRSYMSDDWKANPAGAIAEARMAFDAQPTLTTDPNSAVLAMLTTTIDPEVYKVIYSPLEFADMLGERKVGSWLDETRAFPVVEYTGEVSSYDDYVNNGRVGVNFNWPQLQSYLFQTFISYGEREAERAGLANINFVSELNQSAAWSLNNYQNLTYAFGLQGLQTYGFMNNPYLSASLTPATKANGGTTWFTAGGAPNATANEVYNDIVAMWTQAIAQTNGAVKKTDAAVLSLSPASDLALEFANSFGVFVMDLLKKGFPNMRIVTAPQYGQQSTTNSQGFSVTGNFAQLKIEKIQGQQVAYAAYNEKMRAHKLIPGPSDWKQKTTGGTWGTVMRMPVGVVGMLGM